MYALFYSFLSCWQEIFTRFFASNATPDPFPIILLLEDTSLQVSRSIELLDQVLKDLRVSLLDPKISHGKRKTLLYRRHFHILRRKEYMETKERLAGLMQCLQDRVSSEMVMSVIENATQALERLNLQNIDSTINQMEELFESMGEYNLSNQLLSNSDEEVLEIEYPVVPDTDLTIKKEPVKVVPRVIVV